MAEEEKAEVKLESKDVTSSGAVDNVNDEVEAPVGHRSSGSEEAFSSALDVEQKSSVLEAEEEEEEEPRSEGEANGAEELSVKEDPGPPSEGKTATEEETDPDKQNSEEGEESKPETEKDKSEGID